jgi:tetratricopeptide (TPR) repeat protein
MPKVFLSYAREDLTRARSVAQALEKAGHSVWWDRHIAGGAQYSKEIERALNAADVVVVLWSERSIESPWVRDEAANGRDRGCLVPVCLEGCEPPLGFRQFQTIDLPAGRIGRARRDALLGAVDALIGEDQEAPPERADDAGRKRAMLPSQWISAGLVLMALTAIVSLWRPWVRDGELVIAVAPVGTDRASQVLARDLAFRLATLQTSSSGAIRLVEAADAEQRPDLTFEPSAMAPTHAGLVLKSAKDKAILWSKDFEQQQGQRADLLQQMAYTAARVTSCAMEGFYDRPRLKAAVLKTYLNACAQLAEMGSADPQQPVAMLLDVIEASPRFTPAWSKLLLAEATMISPEFTAAEIDVAGITRLRRHIHEARKIEPAMAEAAIAEGSLLQPRDFAGRVRRTEAAAAHSPESPAVISHLADALARTGRTREAVKAAARAVQLDPLSPSIHGNYVAALAYAGSPDSARRELAKAQQLWPGTASLRDAQYRFHLRYGDPRIALTMFEQQSGAADRAPRLYLEARKDPTATNVERFLTFVRERLQSMENPSAGIGFATLAFGHFGKSEEVFSTLLAWPKADDVAIISDVLFRPEFEGVRRDPRFLQIAQRAGLLDYWRSSGKWPDFCFEPDLPYDCKAIASKLVGESRLSDHP